MPQMLCPPRCGRFNEAELAERVRAEFREMPGLKLTLVQASRLFDVDPIQCERVFSSLVVNGQLATDGRMFTRSLT